MIYYLTFACLLVAAVANINNPYNIKRIKAFMILASCWLIIHDGFRWEMATDWDKYYKYFQNCLTENPEELEIGYVVFSQTVRFFTENYTVFLVLFAIIEYCVISKFCLKYSPLPAFSLFAFYFMFVPYLGMNRQFLAMFFCMVSIKFILSKNIWKYCICLLFAFSFHKSCILFFPAYYLNLNKYYPVFGWALLGCFAISVSGILNNIPVALFYLLGGEYVGDKMNIYTDIAETGGLAGMLGGVLKRVFWLFLIAKKFKELSLKKNFFLFFYIYLIGIMMYVLFYGTIFMIIVERGVIYYSFFEIVVLAYIFLVYKKRFERVCLFTIVTVYGIYNMYKGFNYYVMALGTDVFFPYKSVLFSL